MIESIVTIWTFDLSCVLEQIVVAIYGFIIMWSQIVQGKYPVITIIQNKSYWMNIKVKKPKIIRLTIITMTLDIICLLCRKPRKISLTFLAQSITSPKPIRKEWHYSYTIYGSEYVKLKKRPIYADNTQSNCYICPRLPQCCIENVPRWENKGFHIRWIIGWQVWVAHVMRNKSIIWTVDGFSWKGLPEKEKNLSYNQE